MLDLTAGRPGLAAVPPAERRGAGAVRRRGRAGAAVDRVAGAGEVGDAGACRSKPVVSRRAGARVRRRAADGRAGDGQGHRTGEPGAAAGGSDDRAGQHCREPRARARRRHGRSADAAVRLDTPSAATCLVEVLPAPVERELAGVPVRWRNLGGGMRAQVVAVGREGQRARPAGRAGRAARGRHRGIRGPCRPRSRPVQSARSGRSSRALRPQHDHARRRPK